MTMRKGNASVSRAAALALVMALVALPLISSASPIWKKFGADAAQTGRSDEVACRTGDMYWKFAMGNFNFCSPAITEGDTIVAGSRNGLLFGVSPDGDLLWTFDAIARVDSSPAIDENGNIYFGAGDGLLYCITGPTITASEGTLNWAFDAGDAIFSSPALDQNEESVFFGTVDGRLISIFSENFAATQGTVQWSMQLGDNVFASPAYRYYELPPSGSTVMDRAMLFVGSELDYYYGFMYGIEVPRDPAASTLATIDWVYPGVDDDPIGPVQSSVAISDDGNFIYFGSKDGNLYCLSSSGYLQWSYETSGMIDSSPAIMSTGDVVVGSRDAAVYCVDEAGTLKWSFETNGPIESSPAIDVNDNVIIGSRDHAIYSISPMGAENWLYIANYHIWSSPVIGRAPAYGSGPDPAIEVTTSTIYFTCADMNLYAIREDRVAPGFLSRDPDDGQTGVSKRLAYITFEVVDSQTDVDRETIRMMFEGMIVHPTFERIDEDGYRGWRARYYCGDFNFQYDQLVFVHVRACDTAWEPNCMDEIYSFRIESGSRGKAEPQILDLGSSKVETGALPRIERR